MKVNHLTDKKLLRKKPTSFAQLFRKLSSHRTKKQSDVTLKTGETVVLNQKPLKNKKKRNNVSGKSHSAKNSRKFYMLAKRFVSTKRRGGVVESKVKKVA